MGFSFPLPDPDERESAWDIVKDLPGFILSEVLGRLFPNSRWNR
jgi:hypothetical protein